MAKNNNPFGRGRRSAALDEALSGKTSNPGSAAADSKTPVVPFGRGALRHLLDSNENSSCQTPASQITKESSSVPAFGRGIHSPLNHDSPPLSAPFGRGFGRGFKSIQSSDSSVSPSTLSSGEASPPSNVTPPIRYSSSDDEPRRLVGSAQKSTSDFQTSELRHCLPFVEKVGPEVTSKTLGTQVDIGVNCVRVSCDQQYVFQYDVQFSPMIDSRRMREAMISKIDDPSFLCIPGRVFNGRCLYLPRQLPQDEVVFRSFRPTDGAAVSIKVKLTNKTPLRSCPSAYNIIFRKIQQYLRFVPLGRHYFDPTNFKDVPNRRLTVWSGFITRISQHEDGLMLLLDTAHRVIQSETVYEVIVATHAQNPSNFENAFSEKVVGQSVLTRYNNKIMRIDDICMDLTPKSTFERGGTKVSYMQYYKEQYNIDIQDDGQPLLLHKPRCVKGEQTRLVCLVPELCYLTGLSEAMRKDYQLMKSLATHTKLSPNNRLRLSGEFIDSVNKNPECLKLLRAWGINIVRDPLVVSGRLLPPEDITFGNNAVVKAGPTAEFKQALKNQIMLSSINLTNWFVVCLDKDQSVIRNFVNAMCRRAGSMGMEMQEPEFILITDDGKSLNRKYIVSITNTFQPGLTQLVFCAFPNQRDDRYNAVKKICCTELVVPSQCVLTKTVSNAAKVMSVAVNVVAQINVKLGGSLWGVKIPMKSFMVVGLDVYHSGKGNGRSSVCGVVASLNTQCTRWYSRCAFQKAGQEITDSIRAVLVCQLKNYREQNGFLPNTIFIYRDGVGDGMLGVVQHHEVPQLLLAFQSFGEDYKPRVIFIVVQKRINQRMFRVKGKDNFENASPGSVLDHTITRPNTYDFFMVPQHVNQGTVTPTHYIVLYENFGMPADRVQALTFRQCHLYYNWPGSIRIPAPCQYAHKLCYMVGQNILAEPDHRLADRLYYL